MAEDEELISRLLEDPSLREALANRVRPSTSVCTDPQLQRPRQAQGNQVKQEVASLFRGPSACRSLSAPSISSGTRIPNSKSSSKPKMFGFHLSGKSKCIRKSSSGKPFLKEVILLPGPDATVVPRQHQRRLLQAEGFILFMYIEPWWTGEQLMVQFRAAFPSVPQSVNLEIMLPDTNSLFRPLVAGESVLDGILLKEISKRKSVYLLPDSQLLDDALLTDDKADDLPYISQRKKMKFNKQLNRVLGPVIDINDEDVKSDGEKSDTSTGGLTESETSVIQADASCPTNQTTSRETEDPITFVNFSTSRETEDPWNNLMYREIVGKMDEDEAFEEAIQKSLEMFKETDVCSNLSRFEDRTQEVLSGLVSGYSERKITGPERRIVVSRSCVWKSTLRYFSNKVFAKKNSLLKVSFASDEGEEDGADAGGPRREYFRLLQMSIIKDSGLLAGTAENGYTLRANVAALMRGEYEVLGQILATNIIQGGEPPSLFNSTTVDQILEKKGTAFLEDVVECNYRQQLEKVLSADSPEELVQSLDEDIWWQEIDGVGIISMDNRKQFVEMAARYLTTIRNASQMASFKKGLEKYDLLKFLQKHNLRELIQFKTNTSVSAKDVLKLFKPKYKVGQIKEKEEEVQLFCNFRHFIESIEAKELLETFGEGEIQLFPEQEAFIAQLTPEAVLIYGTGASRIPSTGFTPQPNITFHHDQNKHLPTAITCTNEIQLFVNEENINLYGFASNMLTALMNGITFSKN